MGKFTFIKVRVKVIQGGSREADGFYVGTTLLNVGINKSGDCQLIVV